MAKGKNKKLSKRGKMGRKNEKHAFLKKEWYQLICPSALKKLIPVGWTCCNKPVGTQVISELLKGRVAEICYADITGNVEDVTKKVKIIVDEIHGKNCATSFYGFELARDAVMETLRKRQTLIDVYADLKTTDGNIFRVFVQIVTQRGSNQLKMNSYAKQSKVKLVRKVLISELQKDIAEKSTDSFAFEVITGVVNKNLSKIAQKVLPGCQLQVYKLKTVKRGLVDSKRLANEAKDIEVKKVQEEENPEAKNLMKREE